MSIYSVSKKFRLGKDDNGNPTYGTAWLKDGGKITLLAGVETLVDIPQDPQYEWAFFTYEPGGNSVLCKPDDLVPITPPTNVFTPCIEQFNRPLMFIRGDTKLRLYSQLGATLTIHFGLGTPI